MKKIIELQNIQKIFKDNIVLNQLNLVINRNDVIYIHGPNGSGKSTLLKIIAGLLSPDYGSIIMNDSDEIGALIENPEFANSLTLKENLEFLFSLKHKVDYEKMKYLCERFGLNINDNRKIKNYSIGMRQKAGIIQAIMENQSIILLDEPSRGLDAESVNSYKELMKEIISEGKTVIVASHEFVDIGFNKSYLLNNGNLILEII